MNIFRITALATLALSSALAARPQLPEFASLAERSAPAVVNIYVSGNTRGCSDPRDLRCWMRRPVSGLGSGFVISADGYVVTNHHVIDGADRIRVRLSDRTEHDATVVGSDELSDLALLKIDTKGLKTLAWSRRQARVGEWVLAIGQPHGLEYSVSAGIVSATGRAGPGSNYVPFVQTDVAINRGNSGGPLLAMDGRVIGINSFILTNTGQYSGLSFAIPAQLARSIVAQLRDNGTVVRGWLGVSYVDIDHNMADASGLDKPAGALIRAVMDDSPAQRAGIMRGDIVLSFDGRDIENASDLPYLVGMATPDEEVTMRLLRDRRQQTIKVRIGKRDTESAQPGTPQPDGLLGLSSETLDQRLAERYELADGGVRITSIMPGSLAADAGLRPGDIILELGANRVRNDAELERAIKDLRDDGRRVRVLYYRPGYGGRDGLHNYTTMELGGD